MSVGSGGVGGQPARRTRVSASLTDPESAHYHILWHMRGLSDSEGGAGLVGRDRATVPGAQITWSGQIEGGVLWT